MGIHRCSTLWLFKMFSSLNQYFSRCGILVSRSYTSNLPVDTACRLEEVGINTDYTTRYIYFNLLRMW